MSAGEFQPRDARIYPPYSDEVPWDLLRDTPGATDEWVLPEAALVRVAKLDGRIIGVYAVVPEEALTYRVLTVVVAAGYRRRGLGRWLLGHAIGLSESKGARRIVAAPRCNLSFLAAAGFGPSNGNLVLTLTPE